MKKIKLVLLGLVAVCGMIPVSFATAPHNFDPYCPDRESIRYSGRDLVASHDGTIWLGTSTIGGIELNLVSEHVRNPKLSIIDFVKVNDSICYAHVSDGGHYNNTVIIFTVAYR
ncbi:MAG TPA: hypothetical protein VKR58_09220 [Aquella sp.]|nr:hypothetical protein [Aquella sp.]